MRMIIATLLGALLLILPVPGHAGSAAHDISLQAERILAVLADPQLKVAGQERARRQAVRRVAEDAIDFSETGRRTLGAHWDARSEAER
jgi:ABC-type transporter MlaC component